MGRYTSCRVHTNSDNSNILTRSRISVWRRMSGPWESARSQSKATLCDSIFFNVKTVHGSKQNMSDKPRPDLHQSLPSRTDDFVIIGGTTTANRAEAEKRAAAAEEAKKANSDRGLMLRGFRPFNLHRVYREIRLARG